MSLFAQDLLTAIREHVPARHHPFNKQILFENPRSPRPPIVALVSHMDDVRELAAAVDLASSVVGIFGENAAPSVVILSAENCIDTIDAEIVPLLADHEVSAIVTFGGWTAQALSAGYMLRGLKVPYIFSGLHSVAHLALTEEGVSRSCVTGVVSKHPEYHRMLSALRYLSPNLNRAVILQHPDHIRGDYREIGFSVTDTNIELCREAGFEPVMLFARSIEELSEKLLPEMTKGNCVVVTGCDSVALSNMHTIVRLANGFQVPVITQSPEAIAAGAAMGCGARGGYSSRLIAERLYTILVGKVTPRSLALDVVYEPDQVYVNFETLHLQGIYPTHEQMVLLRVQSIHEVNQYPLPEKVRMQLERGHTCC